MSGPVVAVADLRAHHAGAPGPALAGLDLEVARGEHVRILGASGAGRTTLARTLAGRIDTGEAEVSAAAGAVLPPRCRAVVLGAEPGAELSGLAPTVEEEIALGLMRSGLGRAAMHARVEEVIALLGLAADRRRPPRELSGGRRHLTSLASGLVLDPDLLVLDDVARGLDGDALAALGRALVALRRRRPEVAVVELDLVLRAPLAGAAPDRTLLLDGGLLAPIAPSSRGRLAAAGVRVPEGAATRPGGGGNGVAGSHAGGSHGAGSGAAPRAPEPTGAGAPAPRVRIEGLLHDYAGARPRARNRTRRRTRRAPGHERRTPTEDPTTGAAPIAPALNGADLVLHPGEIVAVTGRNGAGKTTLLHHVVGLLTPTSGRVLLGTEDVASLRPPRIAERAQLVAQDPNALVVAATVRDEVAFTPRTLRHPDAAREAAEAEGLLDLGRCADEHPLDLPAARRTEVALAAALAARPEVLVLDEPTASLDGPGWERFVRVVAGFRAGGGAVLLATHDPEAVALADRALEVAGGRLRPA